MEGEEFKAENFFVFCHSNRTCNDPEIFLGKDVIVSVYNPSQINETQIQEIKVPCSIKEYGI